MLTKKLITTIILLTHFVHFQSLAEEYTWQVSPSDLPLQQKHSSPESACRLAFDLYFQYYAHYLPARPLTDEDSWWYDGNIPDDDFWVCAVQNDPNNAADQDFYGIIREGSSCSLGKEFNTFTGQCETQAIHSNCPSTITGNPINFLTGYKIQSEIDFAPTIPRPNQIEFSRYYSSANGLWIHNYSSRIVIESNSITLLHFDGKKLIFEKTGNTYTAKQPELGILKKHQNHWSYHSPENFIYEFDNSGQLSKITMQGVSQLVSHTGNKITISDAYGISIHLSEDPKKQPIQLITKIFKLTINTTHIAN